VKRREFITLLAGATAALPLGRVRKHLGTMPRVGVLFGIAEKDPEGRNRIDAFRHGLESSAGWRAKTFRSSRGWAGGDLDRLKAQAAELVRLKPDVLVAGATVSLVALQEATRDIPIVFAQVTDPVVPAS